jgi:hypothetical protein
MAPEWPLFILYITLTSGAKDLYESGEGGSWKAESIYGSRYKNKDTAQQTWRVYPKWEKPQGLNNKDKYRPAKTTNYEKSRPERIRNPDISSSRAAQYIMK